MASTFPTSLDTIPDAPVAPALGGSTPTHAEMHDLLRDAVVAVETRVGITGSADVGSLSYRVSADGEGAAIAALTAKTTPVDADLVGLSDSAAGGVLKKLSWSSIKTALQSVFATLAGIAGGQTLIGGTGATDKLTLQGTSGTGTAGATALRALVGNAGGTEALSITNEGVVTVGTGLKTNMAGQCAIGPGTGLVDFPSSILTPPPKAQTISGFSRPDDNVVQWANQVLSTTVNPSANLTKWTYGLLSEMVTPVSCSFNTSVLAADYSILKRNGSGTGSLYGKYSFVDNAGINTVTTIQCLGSTGYNSGSGTVTQMWGTEGYLGNTGTGTVTTAICVGAGLTNAAAGTITNAYGVNIGGPGEGWPSAGTVTNAYGLYIGSAVNYGTNKWSIYNASPAVSYLAGSLALGVTAASAKVHAISTTEQLRLGYDASNYTSATVDSTGKTTRTGVGTAPNFKWLVSDATTNAIYDLVTFSKNSSGAGAAGLGVRVNLAAKSSTTADTLVGAIDASWVDATHASRKGRVKISAYDTAIREGIRVEASGTAAMLGFFGVTAVVKPTALTTQLTTLTYTAPTTPDYAIAAVTQTTPFGFTTADEAHTVLSVIKNLQDRVAQLETKLQSLGLLT